MELGWRGSKLCVYTLHTGGVASKQTAIGHTCTCPIWHTAGLFSIRTEAVRAFCDNAMTDSQLIKKDQHHYNLHFYSNYYMHIPLITQKWKRNSLKYNLNSRSSLTDKNSRFMELFSMFQKPCSFRCWPLNHWHSHIEIRVEVQQKFM